jgi:uncharacterized protein YjiS (DUF1127 family)
MKPIFDWLLRAWSARQTRRELYAMTDRQLRDIGLRREQIEFIRLS